MEPIILVVVGLVAVGIGIGIGAVWSHRGAVARASIAEEEAKQRLAEAEAVRRQTLQNARAEAAQLRDTVQADVEAQRSEFTAEQQRLRQKEENLGRKAEAAEQHERRVNQRASELQIRARELDGLRAEELKELERIGQLPWPEARETVLRRLDAEMQEEAARQSRARVNSTRLIADEEARSLVGGIVQRLPAERRTDGPSSVVPVPDSMRGRLIGRNGQNIRALEVATGLEFIVDEVPGAVVISGFDPIKRDIARIAIAKLLQDGRIHPGRIDEVVAKATQEVETGMIKAAKEGAAAAGIHGLHPEVLKVFGRLKYRTSYGQNQLLHSVEVSQIARMLAMELGADPDVAARGALLHASGKVMGHGVDGPHRVSGADLARRFGESPKVAEAIVEHHDSDPETVSVEAVIVQAADAISGARPGARHESAEQYIKRLEALEQVATSYPGVEKSFAIQAGREIRIIVKPNEIDDEGSVRLARDVAKQIEDTLQYPGQVKVTVVRETRATEIAR